MPMQRLPPWIESGSFFLALIAGSVNAVGLMGFSHQAVSHLTGTATFFSLDIIQNNAKEAWHLSFIMLSFVFGAMLSGFIVQNMTLKLGRRYGVVLFIEASLLALAAASLDSGLNWGHFLASAACGLQNAMISTYSASSIRTTHVSGMFTDIGIMFGQRLRGYPVDARRLKLYLILIFGTNSSVN
ncbi:MAG: YoaK family protein, partial [Deinococcales bacterium]